MMTANNQINTDLLKRYAPHKSPHLSYTHFQLNQEIDIRDVNVLALDVAKTSHERS
jgi:hypothetical protein